MALRARFFAGGQSQAGKRRRGGFNINDESNYRPLASLSRRSIKSTEEHDVTLKIRNVFMLVNTLVSLFFLISMFQLEWDGKKSTVTTSSFIVKILILLMTCLQLAQICEYYTTMVAYHLRSATPEKKKKKDPESIPLTTITTSSVPVEEEPANAENKLPVSSASLIDLSPVVQESKEDIPMGPPKRSESTPVIGEAANKPQPKKIVHLVKPTVTTVIRLNNYGRQVQIRKFKLTVKFTMEVLVTLLVPFPVFNPTFSKIGLLMFLRLYILARIIRDHSSLYQKRKAISSLKGISVANPSFDTFLSVKASFHQHPIRFLIAIITVCTLIFGYCIYVLEREAQPEAFTFAISYYLAVTVMLTGWANDTYDQYDPTLWGTKFVCICSVVLGLLLFALLIEYIHSTMQLTYWQQIAIQAMKKNSLVYQERDEAARLIQILYRHHRAKQRQKLLNVDKRIRKKLKIEFYFNLMQQIKTCRRIKKERRRQDMAQNYEDEILKSFISETVNSVKTSISTEVQSMLEQQREKILTDIGERYLLQPNPDFNRVPKSPSTSNSNIFEPFEMRRRPSREK